MFSLLAALAGASGLAVWYFRNRDTGASADALEEVVTTAKRITDAPLYQSESSSLLEEIGMTARKVAATVVASVSTSGVRGLRNNNPGNIRKSADAWKGLRPEQTDSAFFQFTEPKYGVRALGKVLLNYRAKYGLATVRDIINRWAPPVENNTTAYVSQVSRALKVQPDQSIDVQARLPELTAAIIVHENGMNPYTEAQLREWVYLS
jgi:hypothetical protein